MTATLILCFLACAVATVVTVAALRRVHSNQVECVHCGSILQLGNEPLRAASAKPANAISNFNPPSSTMNTCNHCASAVPLEKAALTLQPNRLLHLQLTCPTCGAGYETWLSCHEFIAKADQPPRATLLDAEAWLDVQAYRKAA